MKNINDLMSRIQNNISTHEENKELLNKKKEAIKEEIENQKETSYILEGAIKSVNRKKIKLSIIALIIVSVIYGLLVYNNILLNNETLYILGLILSLDLYIQLTHAINRHISNIVANSYNYVDFYSLYQQYNIVKRDIKNSNNKIVEIELSLDKEDKEIEKLEEIANSVDTLMHEDATYTSQAVGTKKHQKTNNTIYDSIL